MSRVGKKPIPTAGVTVSVSGQEVKVKGAKGELSFRAPDEVAVAHEGGELTVSPRNETARARALWGTTRAVLANQVKGVSQGFEKTLDLVGVGYRAAMQGQNLQLQLGLSHDVIYTPPAGITIVCPKQTEVRISGVDAQVVGQVAAEIRSFRPPEPYKGKGIRVNQEYIRRKEGKKK
jgi:large subunit ribosomal protein L6